MAIVKLSVGVSCPKRVSLTSFCRFELQIMLRMELIECDSDEKNLHVEDICELLDSIQFDIDGVVCGGESLQEYSVRVIHTR